MRVLTFILGGSVVLAIGAASACSDGDSDGTTGSSSSSGGAGGQSSGANTGGFTPSGNGGAGGGIVCDNPGPDEDFDKDGFTIQAGDCNDCDPNVNPGALEAPTKKGDEPVDEDCDGATDEADVEVSCDTAGVVDEMDPAEAVKAVGICKTSGGVKDWGLVSATWVQPDGSLPPSGKEQEYHLGHGVLPNFGKLIKPREGSRLLALSSGTARDPGMAGYQSPQGFSKGYQCAHPEGFPKESPACPGTVTGEPNDGAAIEIALRAPTNAHGIAFDFDFYTYEWPNYVCSSYNDFFVALLHPIPPMQQDGNISFDTMGNPISVNNAFINVCGCPGNPPNPCLAGGKSFACALGNAELLGTGFGFDTEFGTDHGATSWLTSQAPITPSGQQDSVITLRWGVYDSGDGVLDSTALIDRFRWILKAGVPVNTQPVPK